MSTPEEKARVNIDRQLVAAGWEVVDRDKINPSASAQAIREVSMKSGHGQVDYLLYVEGKAIGVLEAKKAGEALSTHEMQPQVYAEGLPEEYPAWRRPLPFQYLSTGEETFFRNNLEPQPRSRRVFSFHKPDTLLGWVQGKALLGDSTTIAEEQASYGDKVPTLLSRIQRMPPLDTHGMWPKQVTAIENLEKSLKENRRKALVQMATGSGKTFTAISECYRLIKYAGAKRILFLVDRKNLGDQAEQEFQRYTTPDTNRKFTELYTVQHLKSNTITQSSRVCISTIQRVFSILKGEEEMPEDADERSAFERQAAGESLSVVYNPRIPPETFDFVIVDECHRSIYNLWSQVLEYFDASLIGLTATPSKHTIGYFDGNQVMRYTHEEAVADGVNVDFSVYRIRTKVTEQGALVEKNEWVTRRDRRTRKQRQEQLDEDLSYGDKDLDRSVVNPSQVRTVIQAFRDKLFTEIFPGRKEVPKTLIFAKDDDHAELIVRTVRDVFAKGDEFCRKITYRAGMHKLEDGSYKRTNVKVDDIIKAFTNSFLPRIAVTVDMIATGTDTKPVEIVFFMRDVKSENYFEQMKGRGVRVMGDTDFQAVSEANARKERFVIVDAVGVCEGERQSTRPLDSKPTVSFEKLLDAVKMGSTDAEICGALGARLAKTADRLSGEDNEKLLAASGGVSLKEIARGLLQAVDPERHEDLAREKFGGGRADFEPSPEQMAQAEQELLKEAVKPLHKPEVRQVIEDARRRDEQTIDIATQDTLLEAGHSAAAREKAGKVVGDFKAWIEENKDEIDALRALYSVPYKRRLNHQSMKQLLESIQRPPRRWTPEVLWRAYEQLEKDRVRGAAQGRRMADLVSLIRHALGQEEILEPFEQHVRARFDNWLAQQENKGRKFTGDQLWWLHAIRDVIATDLAADRDIFEDAPFVQKGGLGKAYQLFGEELDTLLDELSEALVA